MQWYCICVGVVGVVEIFFGKGDGEGANLKLRFGYSKSARSKPVSQTSGAEAQVYFVALSARLNSFRKIVGLFEGSTKSIPQGLKPGTPSAAFAARVNSCPDTNHVSNGVFPPLNSCPDTNHVSNGVFPQAVKSCRDTQFGFAEVFVRSRFI